MRARFVVYSHPSTRRNTAITDQRVALVTGASRGIGRAIGTRLAEDGHYVVAIARTAASLEALCDEVSGRGRSIESKTCDVADSEALTAVIEEIASTCGRLDILVNNAGITRDGLILRMSDQDFDEVINTNLRSVFVASRAAARPMMKGRFGRIINIGSVTGIVGNAGQANYAAAKAGLIGLTKSLAKELGSKGITANVIAPGFVETDMTAMIAGLAREEIVKAIPVRRFGTADEIAHAVSFVASEKASYLTGQVLTVDGGLAM